MSMSKSGGRKAESKDVSAQKGRALSPDEADRAAAAFVPLWQFDDAPFAASPKVAEADLRALSSPKATLIGMQLATAPVLTAAIAAPAPVDPPPPVVAALPPAPAAPTEQDLSMSRSTIKMTPLHQPNVERPADPDLPSVIVDAGTPAAGAVAADVLPTSEALRDQKTAPLRVARPAAPPEAPRAELRGPKTIPPTSRARSAPRPRPVADPEDLAGAGYKLPRSRTPLMIGLGIAGSAVLILAVYAVSSAMSSPSTPAATSVTRTDPSPRTADPGPAIPPPPPADEAPVAAAPPPPAPPPPAPVPDPANIPVATPANLPAAPPIHAATHATPSPPAVAAAPPPLKPAAPPAHPAKPRNPPPAPASGGIVRDNPF